MNEKEIKKAIEWIKDNYELYIEPIDYYTPLKKSFDINAFTEDFEKEMMRIKKEGGNQ